MLGSMICVSCPKQLSSDNINVIQKAYNFIIINLTCLGIVLCRLVSFLYRAHWLRYRKYIIIFNTTQLFGSIICCVLCEADSSCVYSFRGQCKINSQRAFLLMLFWLLKDALLAFKRALIEVLLTPFWSPIKHLLLLCFASVWFSVSYKGSEKGWFLTFLERFLTILCQYFSYPTRLCF